MKKRIGFYVAAWAALLALFNVISFLSKPLPGVEKYTSSFWIGYALISVMFVGQLVCALFALRTDSMKKLFYNVSLIQASYAGLIASFVFGGLCMLIAPLPYWVGVILCAIVLVLNALSVIKASVTVGEVTRIDEKIKAQTMFVKLLTAEAETLLAQAKTDTAKAACRKVHEAIRYSDPMSNESLAAVETRIEATFIAFSDAVKAAAETEIADRAEALLALISERNSKCKLFK